MYGGMILLGIAACLIYYPCAVKRRTIPKADMELAWIYSVVGSFVGAKLLWLLTVWQEFVEELPYLFKIPGAFLEKYLSGGFVFYGGLFGALLAAWLYCRVNRLSFWELCRCMLPILPLFHAFGRLGCFCMGCCYGCPSAAFGISFTCSEIAPNGVPLLPVQLIEAAGELLLFLVLHLKARQPNNGKGMLCIWLISYGLLRFILEFFRGDGYRGFLGALSVSQVLSILALALAGLILLRDRREQAVRKAQ